MDSFFVTLQSNEEKLAPIDIKIVCNYKRTDQWNRIKCQDAHTDILGTLLHDKDGISNCKRLLSQQG